MRVCTVSVVCGSKWFRRFVEEGREGLRERSWRPRHAAVQKVPWKERPRRAMLQEQLFGAKKPCLNLRRDHPRQRVPCVRPPLFRAGFRQWAK